MQRPDPLEPDLVREFVLAAHSDLSRVQTLLEAEPGLLNATWDWGGGDFESAIGAAAHTGQREIAEHLLSKGARMDIFVAAMLGKLAVVVAIIEAMPETLHSRGAHGIPLINHAHAGSADAVVAYLQQFEESRPSYP